MSYSNNVQPLTLAIGASAVSSAPISKTTTAAGEAEATPKASTPVIANDQTTLSLASSLLASALKVSDVRTEKVAALQQTIAAGTYNVSSSDVADKLLQSLLG